MRLAAMFGVSATVVFGLAAADDGATSRPTNRINNPQWILCFAPKIADVPFGELTEGVVVVEFTVNGAEGQPWVTDVVVLESSPAGVFDEVAVKTISSWAFKPLLSDNRKVVPARAIWKMVFDKSSLEGGRIQSACKKA